MPDALTCGPDPFLFYPSNNYRSSVSSLSCSKVINMEKDPELTRPLVPGETDDETSSIDEPFNSRQETHRPSALWRIAVPILSVVLGAALFIGGVLVGSYFNFESRCATHTTQYCECFTLLFLDRKGLMSRFKLLFSVMSRSDIAKRASTGLFTRKTSFDSHRRQRWTLRGMGSVLTASRLLPHLFCNSSNFCRPIWADIG